MEGTIKGLYEYLEKDVWECPTCGRLAIDLKNEEGESIIKWYRPEDKEPGFIFDISNARTCIFELKKSIERLQKKLKEFEDI